MERPGGSLRAFYFLYYATVGITLPYFSLYLEGLGLSSAQIGLVQMVQPLVAGIYREANSAAGF